jgi:type IV secretion system protein TrbI
MAENDPIQTPQVQDKRVKPSGVLPKNAQAWVLSGLALLMVAVIALSGRTPSKERGSPELPATSGVMDPNAARIQEYQTRIEEQARKLQLEQAQLARTQQALTPGGATGTPSQIQSGPYMRPGEPRYASPEPDPVASSIQADKEKRAYQSLFASNVALSYRRENAAERSPLTQETAITPPGVDRPELLPSNSDGKNGTRFLVERPNQEKGESVAKTRIPESSDFDQAEGKAYRLFEGTVLETVLTNRLDGDFSGPINCMVTTGVYSHDGQRLVIPQGSRVLGEVRKLETFGQQRLAVFFHRIIMPDGYSVSLDKFQGLNQIGETGLRDQVNHHYLQIFGVSLAIGAIAGLAQANTRAGLDVTSADAYRQGVATSLSQSSLNILDRYLNVLPTFTIREGHRVKVYLSNDLLLPAYEKHQMPSDL